LEPTDNRKKPLYRASHRRPVSLRWCLASVPVQYDGATAVPDQIWCRARVY